jgi:hypothetical protein
MPEHIITIYLILALKAIIYTASFTDISSISIGDIINYVIHFYSPTHVSSIDIYSVVVKYISLNNSNFIQFCVSNPADIQ